METWMKLSFQIKIAMHRNENRMAERVFITQKVEPYYLNSLAKGSTKHGTSAQLQFAQN